MGSQLPKLVPINDELIEGRTKKTVPKKKASWSGSEEEYMGSQLPKLVPINDELIEGNWMKGKKPVQRKPVRYDSDDEDICASHDNDRDKQQVRQQIDRRRRRVRLDVVLHVDVQAGEQDDDVPRRGGRVRHSRILHWHERRVSQRRVEGQ